MTDLQSRGDALADQARIRARRAEEQGERGRIVCGGCGGDGWVERDATGRTTVEPCSRCRTATWERWKGGHYRPDHCCELCRPTPKGNR